MGRARSLCCFVSPTSGKPSDVKTRRSTAACICCIGPHHKPSGAAAGGLGPNNGDLSSRSPLISCCGSGDVARGRTPTRTPCTPTARRLCGVRSRTPRRAPALARVVAANAAAAADARTPRTSTTPLGRQQRGCCVRGNAKLGRRSGSWFRSALQAVVAKQQTPRFQGRDGARGGANSGVKVHDARVAEVEAHQAAKVEVEEETCSHDDEYARLCREGFSREDVAAVTIQAFFRAHLARRAFKALKSLVRLQAVARGAYVRRQVEVAIHCMQAMMRLQVRVRARQMLTKPEEERLLQQN